MTRLAYVAGHPIGHSLSPAIHNAAFRACGIDGQYRAADVDPSDLATWVAALRANHDALGCNVTVPHKEQIVPYLDEVTGDARLVGAVNTVIRKDNADGRAQLIGENTDPTGFRRSLEIDSGATLAGQRVVLLGAGGAARAITLVALQDGATELTIVNRHVERAERLLSDLQPLAKGTRTRAVALDASTIPNLLEQATVVVNATSVGLRSDEMPVDPSPMTAGSLAVDIVYNPPKTSFLRAAERQGARTLPGLGMLVHQAAAAFELWTGVRPPTDVMWKAAEQALQSTR